VFDNDGNVHGKWTIRVFSIGATILEYLKIFAGIWTFVLSLMVVAFWSVLHLENDSTPTYLWFDLALDFLYVVCLIYQLRTSILDVQTGREYCSRKAIHARNFFSKCFWFDIFSCIPLIFIVGITSSTLTRLIAFVKSLRGWRIFRTPPEHLFVPSTSFQLFQLSGFIMMGGHLIACLWFSLVHEAENTMVHHSPASESYAVCLENGSASCLWELYTVSINQGIYLLMGIECNAYSAWEHFFVTVCAPLGALVHAYMLGRIILLIQRRGTLETKKNEHTMAIQEAMRTLDLPPDLQMRIVTFFTYERIHRSGRLFKELFEDLSPQLRFELQLHLYLDLVGKSQLFRKTKPRVIREIVMSLNDIIFLPGDWVCRQGDYGDSMYFIVSGECSVIGQDTITELKNLKRQDYFGEVALLTGVARTVSVRANRFCIMAHLTKDNFAPVVQKWPDEMDVLLVNVENHADRMKIKSEAAKLYGLSRRHSMASDAFNTTSSISNSNSPQAFSVPSMTGQAWRVAATEPAPKSGESKESISRSHSVPSVQAEHLGPLSLISNSNSVDDVQKSLKKFLHDVPGVPDDLTHDKEDVSKMGSRYSLLHATQSGAVDPHRAPSTTSSEALHRVQNQLNQVGARVRQLQKEIVDQRSMLKNDLASMKTWAVEATKQALSHEVRGHDFHQIRSRRQSVESLNSATNTVANMLFTPVT
jgi:voltage-gated potassium channel